MQPTIFIGHDERAILHFFVRPEVLITAARNAVTDEAECEIGHTDGEFYCCFRSPARKDNDDSEANLDR
jgi:hypothetical protein